MNTELSSSWTARQSVREQPYAIRFAPAAGPLVREQPVEVRARLRSVMQEVAQLAAEIDPVDPRWMALPGQKPPVLRLEAAGVEIFYTVENADRAVTLLALRPAVTS